MTAYSSLICHRSGRFIIFNYDHVLRTFSIVILHVLSLPPGFLACLISKLVIVSWLAPLFGRGFAATISRASSRGAPRSFGRTQSQRYACSYPWTASSFSASIVSGKDRHVYLTISLARTACNASSRSACMRVLCEMRRRVVLICTINLAHAIIMFKTRLVY